MKFNFDTRLTVGLLLLLVLSVVLIDETFAYNLQGVRFLPRGDGINGQQGVVLGVTSLIQGIANGLAALAGAVAVLFIVINGARMTFSFGDTEALSKARKGLMWSVAGLLLVVFAYVIAKSVVALVYSGEGVGTASGIRSQMSFGVNEYTRTCRTVPQLPESCYTGDIGGTQTAVGDEAECKEIVEIGLKEYGVCNDMELGASCTVEQVQGKAIYDGLPAGCSAQDGKYGQCTIKAIKAYYKAQCGEVGGSVNGLGTSSAETSNPRINELVNLRQTLFNQVYVLNDQFDAMGCDGGGSSEPGCTALNAEFEAIKTRVEELSTELQEIAAQATP